MSVRRNKCIFSIEHLSYSFHPFVNFKLVTLFENFKHFTEYRDAVFKHLNKSFKKRCVPSQLAMVKLTYLKGL